MRLLMLVLCVLLAGCSDWPQNPKDFRERAKQSQNKELVDSIEVPRSFADVSATLRKQSDICLNQKVTLKTYMSNVNSMGRATGGGITRDTGTATYKSSFTSRNGHAELAVQRKVESSREIEAGNVPEGGAYRIVVDIVSVSASRTRITAYRMFLSDRTDESLRDAIFQWGRGENLICSMLDK